MENQNRRLNKRLIHGFLRRKGYTHGQIARMKKYECSSPWALNTLVHDLKHDDTSHYETIVNPDGDARTAIEISNPELDNKIITVLYTKESMANDLEKLLKLES